MKKTIWRWAVLAAVAMAGLTGCSTQDTVTPADVAPTAAVQPGDQELQAAEAAMARLSQLVLTTEFTRATDQDQWKAVEAAMAEYGLRAESADKSARLPSVLLVATAAAEAINAVNSLECFTPLTAFVNDLDGNSLGFSASWLTLIPAEGGNAFHCSVYVDRPAVWPENTVVVSPYSAPIAPAAERHFTALGNPGLYIYASDFWSDALMMYNYSWAYHSPIGDRVGQVMKFRFSFDS